MLDAHAAGLADELGFVRSERLTEEGGRMVVFCTTWRTQLDCLKYHSSRNYRQIVAKTMHLIIGDAVVKMFGQYSHDDREVSA